MRKIEGIVKKKHDIVIIDHEGSEWLKYCIPKIYTPFIVKVNTLPFIKSISFLYSILKSFLKTGLTSVSLLSAIILELKPKVIVTFVDNNRFAGRLQTIFPDILIISIQNGVRINDSSFVSCGKSFSFPSYFGFGKHEFDMMKNKNAKVKKYYSKGSFKMGVFLSNFYRRSAQRQNGIENICLISQYKGCQSNSGNSIDLKFIRSYRNICILLHKLSQESNISITIVMRCSLTDDGYQDELNFFQYIFGCDGAITCAYNSVKMLSYQIGMDSSLVVAFDSTLLFELFGAGKKILCYGNVDKDLADAWGNTSQCSALPNEVLLKSWDYSKFREKVRVLLEMSDNYYLNKTRSARRHYMNFSDKYSHQIIHSLIQDKCKE